MPRAAVPPPVAVRPPARPTPPEPLPVENEPVLVPQAEEPADEVLAAPARRGWRAVSVAGEVVVTAGLIVLLFVVYELFITDLFTARDQSRLAARLQTTWQAAPAREPQGEPPGGAPVAGGAIPPPGADFQR